MKTWTCAGILKVTGKGDKTWLVYLVETESAVLSAWLDVRESVALEGVDAVFVVEGNHTNGTAMSSRAIRYLVDGYLDDLGLKSQGVSCHSLRHSAATWARARGAALDALAGMLGHASVETTQVYAQVVHRMTENPARYLECRDDDLIMNLRFRKIDATIAV